MPPRPVASQGSKALDALRALENRPSASKTLSLDLSLPPRPVPRRKRAFISPIHHAGPPPPGPVADVVLDGFVLLEACRVEDPDEAEKAVLEGCGISSVISEDLSFFRKLTHLDLGDNQVQLASLAYLPALVELHLDCNGLIEVTIPPGGFPTLEVLNLSYNGLTAAAIAALADVPRLRQLDLSMNELTSLPADLSGFGALQSLNCEHNLLSSEATFLALGTMPALRSLSLAHNRVEALAPAVSESAFGMLSTFDLSHNLIKREEALLPVLQMSALRTLLLYHNPFLRHGAASDDFHEVLHAQRGVDVVTVPPAEPQPPGKMDLSAMTTVSEPPSRRATAMAIAKAKQQKAKADAIKAKGAAPAEESGSSFFITAGSESEGAARDPEMDEATAAALHTDFWAESDALFNTNVDMRTAMAALKRAVERPPVRPTNNGAHHLQMTANLQIRRRDKVEGAGGLRTRPLYTGQQPPQRAGGAAEDLLAGVSEIQDRLAGHSAARAAGQALALAGGGARTSGDPSGDACVSHLESMLEAMGDMRVGATGGSAPGRPSVA